MFSLDLAAFLTHRSEINKKVTLNRKVIKTNHFGFVEIRVERVEKRGLGRSGRSGATSGTIRSCCTRRRGVSGQIGLLEALAGSLSNTAYEIRDHALGLLLRLLRLVCIAGWLTRCCGC
jgi:hypothetical protein